MLLLENNFVSIFIVCIFVLATPPTGMPLFCFKNKILKVGIEIKMKGVYIKTFYNIGSEKNWILSAMEDNQNKGTMTVCIMTKKNLRHSKTAYQLPCNFPITAK